MPVISFCKSEFPVIIDFDSDANGKYEECFIFLSI